MAVEIGIAFFRSGSVDSEPAHEGLDHGRFVSRRQRKSDRFDLSFQ
jgi:hypothetical protein